jgi:hypothetical protein
MASKCCLVTYQKVWVILDEFHHADHFLYRHHLMDPQVDRGVYADHPVGLPDMQTFINALEDIASMTEKNMGNEQTPPVADKFTQVWLSCFRNQRSDLRRARKDYKAPDLSIKMILCTDLYLAVQCLIGRVDVTTVPQGFRSY